jgi:hypothetical protein
VDLRTSKKVDVDKNTNWVVHMWRQHGNEPSNCRPICWTSEGGWLRVIVQGRHLPQSKRRRRRRHLRARGQKSAPLHTLRSATSSTRALPRETQRNQPHLHTQWSDPGDGDYQRERRAFDCPGTRLRQRGGKCDADRSPNIDLRGYV